jgi:hypothetical protein
MENNDKKIQISQQSCQNAVISCIHFYSRLWIGIILELGTQMESVIILK